MNLPSVLATALSTTLKGADTKTLTHAANELSDAYRAQSPRSRNYMTTDAHRLAYLAVRFPATYATVSASLKYAADVLADTPILSCLDLGAGPGTASWAATQTWPEIERITLIEQNPKLIALGKRLSTEGPPVLQEADWQRRDITSADSLPQHDLVICSYAIGELVADGIERLIDAAWQATGVVLVIVEPGTVPGFERIRTTRDRLIQSGAHVIAPCPHANACTMPEGDWCHFAQRLDRTALHRQLKMGELGYEDEKYAYVAVTRNPASLPTGRILRHPQRRSGHTHLTICTPDGIQEPTVTRRQKSDWKRVRRASWGDAW